ncbi:MAG TPA: iron-containing alcohol dehydrogenase, partial [Synergistales bacterium]|nr:iron-containing alcohol dehydrogenase [Synergistales bacterium]
MSFMSSFDFILPTRISFGLGVSGELGRELEALGAKKVLIVTDKGIIKAGLLDRVAKSLEGKVHYEVFDGVEANPKDRNTEEGAAVAREMGADCVVALGGGSPIDAAKVVCILAPLGGRAQDYKGKEKVKGECLPLVTIPTTAGTGSEVTRWATVWDTDGAVAMKRSLDEPFGYAERAYVDLLLTLSCPWSVTCDTALDALS